MTDYHLPLQFGVAVTPTTTDIDLITATVKQADALGLDLVGIQDHPYQSRFLDTWTLIAYLAAQTEQIRFFADVANIPLRPPAVLAKAAASLDQLTGGRIEFGIGAGGFWDAIGAMGGPQRTPGEAVEAFDEAIQITRLVWSNERSVSFNGTHYQLKGYHPGPQPAHPMGIWVGALGPRMLKLIGRRADGWIPSNTWATADKVPTMQALIDDGARAAGRDPATIRRIYNVMGYIGGPVTGQGLTGSASVWVNTLTNWVIDLGVDSFIFWPAGNITDQVHQFVTVVIPQVRERVAEKRQYVERSS